MSATTNGNSPTLELKQTLAELKQGLELAVEKKASMEVVTKLQAQVDAIDIKLAQKHVGGIPQKSIVDTLKENENIARLLHNRKGSAYFSLEGDQVAQLMQRKTIISNLATGASNGDTLNPVGASTSGVLTIDRSGQNIVVEARQALRIEDVIASRPTDSAFVDFVKVSSPLAIASPVAEGSVKPENSVSFASVSEKVRTIATWMPATRQVLDDFQELLGFLQSSLPYYVNLAIEKQILAGDATGENLHGLIPQASTFNASLLPSAAKGWTKIDVVGAAVEQVAIATEVQPTFIVLNPADWWSIRLVKDSYGHYILGEPASSVAPTLFGLNVVATTSIAAGTFLVGSGTAAVVELRERMKMEFEISTEHASFFTSNLIACRAERRVCLTTKRPSAFVSGTFSSSP